jgi:putative membrane protein insertion efficiency factor
LQRPFLVLTLVIAVTAVPVAVNALNPKMKGPPRSPVVHQQEEKTHPEASGRVFLSPIRFFQQHISPIDGPRCQFSPTCSTYGHQAVRRQGPFLGILITADRLMRCNYWTDRLNYVRLPDGHLADPLADNLLEE